MIGMAMGIDGIQQIQAQFLNQCQITVKLLEHRVDDHRTLAGCVSQYVGVRRRGVVVHLSEDHDVSLQD